MVNSNRLFIIFLLCLILSACTVGPDYHRPCAVIPTHYKENKNWKVAKPFDYCERGHWWKIFKDKNLNALEDRLTICNQNIANAVAQYYQALALVDQARAAYFPTVTGSLSVTRAKSFSNASVNTITTTSGPTDSSTSSTTNDVITGGGGSSSNITNSHALLLNASWEPDLWGSVRRSVEANRAGADASRAQLALVKLSAQASLAQFYFQVRTLDMDQKILDDTVIEYQKTLKLTQNRYNAGVAARADVVQAQSQLETAQAQAINNKINREQFEHAIAVLIGVPPADLNIPFKPLNVAPPAIPVEIPSALLERRPDIAQAERLMAQANAQIGVSIAAYFPSLSLSGTIGNQGAGGGPLTSWFSIPALGWSLGPQLTQIITDGGLQRAITRAARANYFATVATYRQTVLAAFQDVENSLVALNTLNKQAVVQTKAARSARLALQLVMNQYKAGLVPYTNVLIAQVQSFNAEKNLADVNGLRMTSAVGLIKALGGDWDSKRIFH